MLRNTDLTPKLIRAVREAVPIIAIAWPGHDTYRRDENGRISGPCPFCENTLFSVAPEANLFYCHNCHRGGDAIKLYMGMTGESFPQAIESLRDRFCK
jgi:DNA primase